MSRRCVLIACLLVVIGVFTGTTPSFARVIHCGSISLEVPDTWKAYDGRSAREGFGSRARDDDHRGGGDRQLGSWEACEDGSSLGYLTAGVLNRSSFISPLGAARSRRELESHLRDLPRVEAVRVREFETLEIDGVPAYRACYTLSTREHEPVEQSLYIVGGRETSFLAFTRAASSSSGVASSFDEIMRRARVHNRPLLLGLSREWSLAILAALAGSSLLFHAARAVCARARAPVPVAVKARERHP